MGRVTPSDRDAPGWSEYAFERFMSTGRRRGGARSAVVEVLSQQDCALSAEEIENALSASQRGAARASVYRVLDELESLDLVSRIDVGDGVARYEVLYPGGANHHHHMVCTSCGELVPFMDDELERAIRRLSRRVEFEVSDHDVLLRGQCHDCGAA